MNLFKRFKNKPYVKSKKFICVYMCMCIMFCYVRMTVHLYMFFFHEPVLTTLI